MDTLDTTYNKPLDPLTCELAVSIHEQLRYTTFISTKELQKLQTCHNLEKLNKYFELEQKILDRVFLENPELKKKKYFIKSIEIDMKNYDILSLIQEYISIDYIRKSAQSFGEENIKKLDLYIKKDTWGRFYISDIKILS